MCGNAVSKSHAKHVRGAERGGAAGVCVAARQHLVGVREAPGRPAGHGKARLPAVTVLLLSPQVLPCLLRPFSHVLYHLPLGTVTSLVQQLTNLPQSATAPAPTNLHLTAVLQNKVFLSPSLCSLGQVGPSHPSHPGRSRYLSVVGKLEFPSSFPALDGRAGCSRGAGTAQDPQAASPWRSSLPLLINEGVWQINQPFELALDSTAV